MRRQWIILPTAALAAATLLAAAVLVVLPKTDVGDEYDRLLDSVRDAGHNIRRIESTPLVLRGENNIEPAATLLIILGAKQPYTDEEARFLEEFLTEGGTVIVAEEDGQAGSLTKRFGISFERTPIAHSSGLTPLEFDVDGIRHDLHAQAPTAILLAEDSPASVTAWTSPDAFIDRDNDGAFGHEDPPGPFVVGTEMPLGAGRLITMGSIALLGDATADDEGVSAWRRDLITTLLPDQGMVFLDDSHNGDKVVAEAVAAWLVRATSESPVRWIAAGAGVLGAVWLALALGRGLKPWTHHTYFPSRFRSRAEVLSAEIASAPTARDPEADKPPLRSWTHTGGLLAAFSTAAIVVGLLLRNVQAVIGGLTGIGLLVAAQFHREPRPRVIRTARPQRIPEGSPVSVEVQVRARSRTVVSLRDGVPAEDRVSAGTPIVKGARIGRHPVKLTYSVEPGVRGLHRLGPLRMRVFDPFGLRVTDRAISDAMVIKVSPFAESMKKVPVKVRRPEILLGPHAVNRAGDGMEFHALREYMQGDPMRAINWRASARSRNLMVTQRVLESQTETTLVLDARAVSEAGQADRTPLALGARTAMALAGAARRSRDRFRLVVYGDGVQIPQADGGARTQHGLSDILSTLSGRGNTPFAEVVDRMLTDLRPGTPLILLSGLEDDDTVPDGMRRLLGRGVLPLVISPKITTHPDPDDPTGVVEPNAKAITERRDRILDALRGTGALVVETEKGVLLQDLFTYGVAR